MTLVSYKESIEMNRKKIILASSVSMAVLLPIMFVIGIIPMQIESHSLSPDMNIEEVTAATDLIIKGTLENPVSIKQYDDGDLTKPMIFTDWELYPSEFLKGHTDE